MGMNQEELHRVVSSLQSCVGLRLQNAWQPARDRVVLGLSDGRFLVLVPRGPNARIHTLTRRPRNPQKPFSFQGACRAHLRGPITALERDPRDRVVDVCFGPLRLHLRLTGRSGGLWLMDTKRIIAAYDGPAPRELPQLLPCAHRADPPRFQPAEGEPWETAAATWFGDREQQTLLESARTETRRALRRQLQRKQRLEERLLEDLDRASRAPEIRQHADTLAANLHTLTRGLSQAFLQSLEDPSRTLCIDLDPAQPATATMERLYRKARRLDRVADRVLERLDDISAVVALLTEALGAVEDATLPELRRLRKHAPTQGRRAPSQTRQPWVTWTGPRDERILVGRDARGNRQLTFQKARGHDFWLHLRGRPGAHLLIPMAQHRSPSLTLLLTAAQIALVHAKIPDGAHADVQYTRARHVRSIPGSADGRVLVTEEKVLHVVRDPSVLVGWSRA
jgi:predicted ribosome quality control (RQC) complex YloA/Tae2 family protein